MNYKAAYKGKQMNFYGTGKIAIVTGWTLQDSVAKKLTPEQYAVIGNLYSPSRGLNYLIRNLIANPQIRHLIALNATKQDAIAGGCQCLLDFFLQGFTQGVSDAGRDCWVVNSEFPGYIDLEVPQEILEKLRRLVSCQEATSVDVLLGQVKTISECPIYLFPWHEPQVYPMSEFAPNVVPGDIYGHRIEGKTIADTWIKIIHRIKTTGVVRETSHDAYWQELIDLVAVVTDEPEGFYFPPGKDFPCDRNFIENYIPQILNDQQEKEGIKYSYGQRLRSWFGRDQIEQVIDKLSGDIDAASGVMSLWDVKDHDQGGSPCLNHIWVRVVAGKLSLSAVFRSNDMFSAWVANAMGLRALQLHIIAEISRNSQHQLQPGPLITLSESAHIYSDCYAHADKVIATYYDKLMQQEQSQFDDPVGSFVIEVNQEISVQRITPGTGEVVTTYLGKTALELGRQIYRDAPAINPMHSLYLGIELQKAALALANQQKYCQDR
jgi:thymidylate synthase